MRLIRFWFKHQSDFVSRLVITDCVKQYFSADTAGQPKTIDVLAFQ